MRPLLLTLVAGLGGCGLIAPDCDVSTGGMPTMFVTARDSTSGVLAPPGTWVVAAGVPRRVPSEPMGDSAERRPGAPAAVALYVLPGVYTVVVRAAGYRAWRREGVRVRDYEPCIGHRGERVEARLVREPAP